MALISKYKEESDITIMNCYYQYGMKDPEEENKRLDDYIAIIYKDNNTGEKHHEIIKKPEYTFYKINDNIVLDHNLLFAAKEDVHPVTCRYSMLEKTIAKETGNEDFYKENIATGNRNDNKKLHTDFRILSSDIAVEDYYRSLFGKQYKNTINKISKSFFDIEVDTRWMAGDFVEMGECAINALAFLDESHNIIHSFLLRDSRNPLIQKLEDEYNSGEFNEDVIREFIKDNVGGYKQQIRFGLDKIKVKLHFFDEEILLLKSFFTLVHHYKPDFIEGWNSSAFDLNYIINRIVKLGYKPENIMCSEEWEIKQIRHYIDERHLSDFAERGDYTFISGETTWIDQMIQYASKRKSSIGSYKSFKLDDIGNLVAKVKKLDYSHITKDIGMLPWLDFKTFVLYNIFDVIVQKCIESKTNDLEYIFMKAVINNTSYKKVHRQTVYLINRMNKEFDKLGYIIGNNINKWNGEQEKFPGAMVHDPTHTNSYAKIKINGVPILVLETLLDFDYKSLYPSILMENNIAPNTQIGRIFIPNKVYNNENAVNNPQYNRGGEFIENLVSDNIIVFGHRWLHLANIQEMISDINEYVVDKQMSFSSQMPYVRMYYDNSNNIITCPITYTEDRGICPFEITDEPIRPFSFLYSRSEINE